MSGTKKDEKDNNSKHYNEDENEIQKPVLPANKKYPFQTTTTKKRRTNNNNNNSSKIIKKENKSENSNDSNKLINESNNGNDESSKDNSQIDGLITKKLINDPINVIINKDSSLSEILNKTYKDDSGTTINENLLEVIKVSEINENERKQIRRKDLTEKEIKEICGSDKNGKGNNNFTKLKTPGLDPRFQQQNQTMRCFVMYTDFYRCENILGEGELACQWFKDVFTSICPLDWIRRWDEAREEGRLGWTKGRTQGKFPGNRYGV